MSAAGRVYLGELFGTPEYMSWASRVGHVIDARKLALEFAGKQRPRCGTAYGRALQGLCREHPPIDVPPPPSTALSAIWTYDAVFTTHLSNFPDTRRNPAKAAGYRVVYAQLHNSPYAADNEAELPVFIREAWTTVGWCTYGQDTDPYEDGRKAAEITKRITALRAWKANGELWAEDTPAEQGAWKTEAFLRGWRDGGGVVPLGWSVLSSDTDQFARAYAYDVALSVPGADIDLQVYGSAHPTYTVAAGLGMLSNVPVPRNRTTMTFDVAEANGRGPFADYRTWPGPRRVWIGEYSTAETWAALSR